MKAVTIINKPFYRKAIKPESKNRCTGCYFHLNKKCTFDLGVMSSMNGLIHCVDYSYNTSDEGEEELFSTQYYIFIPALKENLKNL